MRALGCAMAQRRRLQRLDIHLESSRHPTPNRSSARVQATDAQPRPKSTKVEPFEVMLHGDTERHGRTPFTLTIRSLAPTDLDAALAFNVTF